MAAMWPSTLVRFAPFPAAIPQPWPKPLSRRHVLCAKGWPHGANLTRRAEWFLSRDSPQASVLQAGRPLSDAVIATLPRCTRDRALTGGEAAPLDQPWRASHRTGHDDAKALLQAHRHVISRGSRRTGGRRTLCRRPGHAADFLARLAGWLGPAIPSTPTCPRACPDGADAPHLTQNVAYVLHPSCFFDDAPSVRYCPQGPEARGRRRHSIPAGQAPVSGGDAIAPTALPSRCKVLHPRHLGIPCRRDCGLGVLQVLRWGNTRPYTPVSSACLITHWLRSRAFGGIRTIGATSGCRLPFSTILLRFSSTCREVRRVAKLKPSCSISMMTAS